MPAVETNSGGRTLAAVIAASALGLFGALLQFGVTDQFASQYHDPFGVVRHQDRYVAALARVPATEPVGFFTDLPMTETSSQATYAIAQYGIAPHTLLPEQAATAAQPRYWIGSFSQETKPEEMQREGNRRGLTLLQRINDASAVYLRQGAAQ